MKIVLDDGAYMPERAHSTDAGLDLKTPKPLLIKPKSSIVVDTGVHVELPPNTVGMLKSKSGLNMKYGITSEGVIDNNGDEPVVLTEGSKITQLVILPVIIPDALDVVESLEDTERGDNGFGSSGE